MFRCVITRETTSTLSEELKLDMPFKLSDWAFVNGDTAEGIGASLFHMESLGFALALSGIMPVEGS